MAITISLTWKRVNFIIIIILISLSVISVRALDKNKGWHYASQIAITDTNPLLTGNNMILLRNIEGAGGNPIDSYPEDGKIDISYLNIRLSCSVYSVTGTSPRTVTCPPGNEVSGCGFQNIGVNINQISAYPSSVSESCTCTTDSTSMFLCYAICCSLSS